MLAAVSLSFQYLHIEDFVVLLSIRERKRVLLGCYMPVISTPLSEEAGRPLKPSSSRPVWSVKRVSALKRKEEGRTEYVVIYKMKPQ